VLDQLIREELRHQIQLAITEAQSIEHHGHGRRAHAHPLARGRILRIEPFCHPDLPTHLGHNPQMIEMLHHHVERHLPTPLG
jgi:hypothetical protein